MRSVPKKRAARRGEGIGAVLHEQVIVFDADRPVRSEAVFEADADHAAPAGVVAVTPASAPVKRVETAVAIRGHGSAALDVEQDVVGGITDLTGEQAERVDLRLFAEPGNNRLTLLPLKSAQLP